MGISLKGFGQQNSGKGIQGTTLKPPIASLLRLLSPNSITTEAGDVLMIEVGVEEIILE